MHCSSCGHKLEDAWTACPICGARVGGGGGIDPRGVATGDVSQTSLIRDTLAAEYEILEELGRGGMAIVFRAREKALDREVAVKVLPFSLAFDAEFVERFQREARTAAQLEHPNIIPIYRVGRSGQVIYFVMKLVRGGSLATLMEGGGRLPPSEIRRVLVESGRALNYAAEKGIVHRDIKPDNIMFDEHGASVITDFGIAKAASGQRLTSTGMSIGTPHYMSPEQARAQETDGRSDIYSLGVVAYQALIGEVPYDGEDSFAIGYKHIMEPIPEPTLNTADERRLWLVIKRMIAKDPADRFQTGLDLVEEIEGRPATPRRVSGSSTRERLAAMPTTPIPAVTVDATGARPARTSGPGRPAMQRASAQRALEEKRSGGVLKWLVILVVVGAGALFGAGKVGYGPLAKDAPADTTLVPVAPVAAAPIDSTADGSRTDTTKVDSTTAPLPSGPAATAPPPPPRCPAAQQPRCPAVGSPRLPPDSRAAAWHDGHGGRPGARFDADPAESGPARRRDLGAASHVLRGHGQHPVGAGADLHAGPDAGRGAAQAPPPGRPGPPPARHHRHQLRAIGAGLQQEPGLLGHPRGAGRPAAGGRAGQHDAAAQPGHPRGQGQHRRDHRRGGHAPAVGQRGIQRHGQPVCDDHALDPGQ